MLDIIDVFIIADADEGVIFPTAEVATGTIMLLVGVALIFCCIEVVLISAFTKSVEDVAMTTSGVVAIDRDDTLTWLNKLKVFRRL